MMKNVQPSSPVRPQRARAKAVVALVALALGFGLIACSGKKSNGGGAGDSSCVLDQSKIDLCTLK